MNMECDEARILASTAVDQQLDAGERGALDAHMAGCEECTTWSGRLSDLVRRDILAAVGDPPGGTFSPIHARRNRGLRIALGWAGVLLIVWHLPEVITAGSELAVHLSRHQAGFAVALGVAFVMVAIRPDRAYGVLPFVVAFSVVLTAVATIDLVANTSSMAVEARHLLEIGGLVILWFLGAEMGPRRRWVTGSRRTPAGSRWNHRRSRR
jgi:predicted anti-sigma-YlaC factor YlaD